MLQSFSFSFDFFSWWHLGFWNLFSLLFQPQWFLLHMLTTKQFFNLFQRNHCCVYVYHRLCDFTNRCTECVLFKLKKTYYTYYLRKSQVISIYITRYRRSYWYKPHRGEGRGPAGHCGGPAGVPQYCGGPCPLQLCVPGQTAREHLGRSSSGQRYWRPSYPAGSHQWRLTAALRHPEPHNSEDREVRSCVFYSSRQVCHLWVLPADVFEFKENNMLQIPLPYYHYSFNMIHMENEQWIVGRYVHYLLHILYMIYSLSRIQQAEYCLLIIMTHAPCWLAILSSSMSDIKWPQPFYSWQHCMYSRSIKFV